MNSFADLAQIYTWIDLTIVNVFTSWSHNDLSYLAIISLADLLQIALSQRSMFFLSREYISTSSAGNHIYEVHIIKVLARYVTIFCSVALQCTNCELWLVDRPTQLIHIGIFVCCQHTSTNDIAVHWLWALASWSSNSTYS